MDSSVFFFSIVAIVIGGLLVVLGKFRFHQDNKEQNFSSLSSPSSTSLALFSLSRIWTQTYHVFPSFRGEDVRRDFFSHIQMEFQREGITSFIDNNIKRGEPIGPELLRAIRGSKIAIILLSRNYASSNWCLDELVEIMKCREELGQTVIPIFYRVDPSDVKKLTGEFGKVFRKTCAGKTEEGIKRWRQALVEVVTIAGYHSSNWDNEATMIKKIAKDISNSTSSRYFTGLVGMRAYMVKVEPWLSLCSISRVAYNQLSNCFQLSVFMENVKAKYSRPCSDDYNAKLQLAPQFRSQITTHHKKMEIPCLGVDQDSLKDKNVLLDDYSSKLQLVTQPRSQITTNHKKMEIPHLGVAQNSLKDNKVLLEDVDQLVALDAPDKKTKWFGPGSRIIITIRDWKLFREHGIDYIYNLDLPTTDEALQIFSTYSFSQNYPYDGFEELARKVIKLAGGVLPLGLRVTDSYFPRLCKQEWKILPKLKTSLDGGIGSILKFSSNARADEDKELFLRIACFLRHELEIKRVEKHLANKFSGVRHMLMVLNTLIEKLDREIVRKRQFLVAKL